MYEEEEKFLNGIKELVLDELGITLSNEHIAYSMEPLIEDGCCSMCYYEKGEISFPYQEQRITIAYELHKEGVDERNTEDFDFLKVAIIKN